MTDTLKCWECHMALKDLGPSGFGLDRYHCKTCNIMYVSVSRSHPFSPGIDFEADITLYRLAEDRHND